METVRHVSIHINRPAKDVYDYASKPANLPAWASGLSGSIEQIDGQWVAESPMGRVMVAFAPENDFGVLDHDVTLPSGETVYNPVRVTTDSDGSEIVFSVRRSNGAGDEDFERDAGTVLADLTALKRIVERS